MTWRFVVVNWFILFYRLFWYHKSILFLLWVCPISFERLNRLLVFCIFIRLVHFCEGFLLYRYVKFAVSACHCVLVVCNQRNYHRSDFWDGLLHVQETVNAECFLLQLALFPFPPWKSFPLPLCDIILNQSEPW